MRARATALRAAGREKLARFAAAQVGSRRALLVERIDRDAGLAHGLTENYLRASLPLPTDKTLVVGRRVEVEIEAAAGERLVGRSRATATS